MEFHCLFLNHQVRWEVWIAHLMETQLVYVICLRNGFVAHGQLGVYGKEHGS